MSSGRGHEHLDEFALIHMNGRAYDYNLGRFYGVDPVIQFPGNSQSLNPYAYLMNNPLAGTDPTGYMGCAASRIESACDSIDVGHGGRATSDGTIAVTFETTARINNGAEKKIEITVKFTADQLKSIQERGVTQFNITTDEKGNITRGSWTLGPSLEDLATANAIHAGSGDFRNGISDLEQQSRNASRFVVAPTEWGSFGKYVGLMPRHEGLPSYTKFGITPIYWGEDVALMFGPGALRSIGGMAGRASARAGASAGESILNKGASSTVLSI
jgi:RHS repeat-associated protein